MIYIIGGNYQMALEYGKRHLGVHPGMRDRALFFSAMTVAQGPGLRGHEFHSGDAVYLTGLQFATARERLEIDDQIAICGVHCEVEVIRDTDIDVTIYDFLSTEEVAVIKEMAEIEELRRLLSEQQS